MRMASMERSDASGRARLVGWVGWMVAWALASGATAKPPAERVEKLARGVNLSHWFWLPHEDSDAFRDRFVTASDVELIKAAGLTHVRLPVEPGWLWDEAAHAMRAERLERYLRGVSLFTERGVAVVVDVHPARTPWLERVDDAAAAELERMWKVLASSLAGTDPGLVFLEVMNEPHDLADAAVWNRAQANVSAMIRAAAPEHTIICTGDEWGGLTGLLRCVPVADKNVVYSFHFYEPHNFTHQGASWGFDAWAGMSGVPYPATSEALREVARGFESARSREALEWSATREPWDAAAIRARIGVAAAWAEKHDAAVYCGEFGVYRLKADSGSRERWLADVTGALVERGIGWAMWDYASGFALATGEAGARTLDEPTARALGLGAARPKGEGAASVKPAR